MMRTESKYPLVRLPEKIDKLLFILGEDIRNNKFFNHLTEVGFDDSGTRSDFTSLVLQDVFRDSSDELTSFYLSALDRRTKAVKNFDRDSIAKASIKLYIDLMAERRRLKALNRGSHTAV